MTQDRGKDGRQAARAPGPLPRRSRRRWTLAAGCAAAWLFLYVIAGSVLSATLLLVAFAAAAAIAVLFLRSMGVTRDHPWLRRLASRPWRDGEDVLRVAIDHLPDIFVVAPSGALFAPNVVEIQMNPEDLASLCDRMEIGVVTSSATEFYAEQVVKYHARLASPASPEVYVLADEWIPRGRYRLRQGHPEWGWRESGPQITTIDTRRTIATAGPVTVMEKIEPPVPVLRLITGDLVAQTRTPGAEAGRGPVELTLPNVSTISRKHARFAFLDGHWWVTNLGMNGLTVNGAPAEAEHPHPLRDGDTIRWGSRADAVASRVEIG